MKDTNVQIECPDEKAIRAEIASENYAGHWQAVNDGYVKLADHRRACPFCQGKAAELLFGQKVTVIA